MKIAVIGGGISGVSMARLLQADADVTVFEKGARIGGLIACEELDAGLYHKLGGHVFNTKVPQVAEWFWKHFNRDEEFFHVTRNAKILFNESVVSYPIENNIYQLPEALCGKIISELMAGATNAGRSTGAKNLHDFFLRTFGPTLCEAYFFPYNQKVWRCDLREIPLEWLEGKLPMPAIDEILCSNILRRQESAMVHARFFYPRRGGSQFVIDRLAEGLSIRCGVPVSRLRQDAEGYWTVNGTGEKFDQVVYCGDIRELDTVLGESLPIQSPSEIKSLRTRGITNAFCYCDPTDISWLYLPGAEFKANRIIYTGSFSPLNNRKDRMTCVVEFLHGEPLENIMSDLQRLPGRLELQAVNHVRNAYIIPQANTRKLIDEARRNLGQRNLYLLGRFAEWEYYNIDKCIESAMKVRHEMLAASITHVAA